MIRLLISLYLVVFLSIIAINQGSELIWQQLAYQQPDDLRHASQVAKSLQASLSVSKQLPSSLRHYPLDEVAWLAEQKAQLLQGDIVTTYTEKNNALLSFLLTGTDTVVQLGPFKPVEQVLIPKYLLKLSSFVLLALLLMFWLRPLWRDLMQFKHVTEQLAKGQLNISIAPSRFSAIATLTSQFHSMATKVANLMNNQKHLVNAVSHELRTPLARLKFALAMLEPQTPESVSQMSQDVQEMEFLIDEMLGYARLEMAQNTLKFESFDIVALLDEQIAKLKRTSTKHIELVCPYKTLFFTAERQYMARVLQNLLGNADKYGQSKVYVQLQKTPNHVKIVIADDGQGIAETDRTKVFEPFSRLEKSRNKSSGGFGLGLAIVDKIISWHGGRCEIETSKWGGAQFVLTLPKQNQA
ncbi:two-component sensor histidine kinase [Pseudoalteromonas sp. JBTF-M23]|uniref:histidine kinase n=1 Tax=Pseudoalteromonas caenipelagi TaxID=2726988 RepID=A0A849VF89_9GAMM|nr:ATP-binding protein [Pseudoalteromonas caenipelagi]NOU50397.1 two-component sensor histidine kinase [Pseudoalteromonas caenipelagi]